MAIRLLILIAVLVFVVLLRCNLMTSKGPAAEEHMRRARDVERRYNLSKERQLDAVKGDGDEQGDGDEKRDGG